MRGTADFFDGVFDNRTTDAREVWKDGELKRFARRICCGTHESSWRVLEAPWGTYPDHPSNASLIPAQPAVA